MDYEAGAQCAVQIPGKNYANNAIRAAAALGQVQETELSSILATLQQQAFEVRGIAASILQRVAPQGQDEACEKQVFGGGYVGRAEEIRSTLSEAIRVLGTLAKLA